MTDVNSSIDLGKVPDAVQLIFSREYKGYEATLVQLNRHSDEMPFGHCETRGEFPLLRRFSARRGCFQPRFGEQGIEKAGASEDHLPAFRRVAVRQSLFQGMADLEKPLIRAPATSPPGLRGLPPEGSYHLLRCSPGCVPPRPG